MGSALQTLRAFHRATEMMLITPFPLNCYFSHPLMVLKINASRSPEADSGKTLGVLGGPRFPAPCRKELLLAA